MSETKELFVVIDVQNDFCPGGALAVPGGTEVVNVINKLSSRFKHSVLTQDWHSPGHSSFASSHSDKSPFESTTMPYGEQVLWPDHCVQGSPGADFHPQLITSFAELIIRKGFRHDVDSYSAFYENDHQTPTGLAGYISERGFERVFLAGLATDFCVKYSALDGVQLGLDVFVIEDACRAIDMNGSLKTTLSEFAKHGVNLIQADQLLNERQSR